MKLCSKIIHTCIIKELQDAHMQFWPYLDELRPSKLQPGNARKGDLQGQLFVSNTPDKRSL